MQIKRQIKGYLMIAAFLFGAQVSRAQRTDALGTYTPYSLYGIGDLEQQGNAITKSMGGISAGLRDARYINYNNVASVTERDTLSFLFDFGLKSNNIYNRDSKNHSAYNTFNINNFAFSAPIYHKSAFVVGIAPFSNIGYKFETTETDDALIAKYGDIKYRKYGDGSINQIFAGAAMNFFKNFSFGLKGIYYFGDLVNHSDIDFNSSGTLRTVETGWDYEANGFAAEAGLQYFKKYKKDYIFTAGASYRFKSRLTGTTKRYAYVYDSSIADTVVADKSIKHISIPANLTVGVSVRKGDKWMVGIDYQRQDWSNTSFSATPGVDFSPVTESSIKAGFEYIPNKYDIRYYMKRVTYRAGVHYENTYVKLNGKQIKTYGMSLGVSLPVFRLNNSLNFTVDFGQRGSTKNNLVKENYVQFIMSLNLHDIWFIKPRYE